MKEIPISGVKPGMVLSGSTYDLMGNLLFPEGTELSNSTVRILQAWGVKRVQIQDSVRVVAGSASEGFISPSAPMTTSQERDSQRKTRRLTRHLIATEGTKNITGLNNLELEELNYRFALVSENILMNKIKKIAAEQLFLRMQAADTSH